MPHPSRSLSRMPTFARQVGHKAATRNRVLPLAPSCSTRAGAPRRAANAQLNPETMANWILRCVAALAASTLLFAAPAQAKNTAGDCDYFANFLVTLSAMRDAGKPKAETVAFARKKATADNLGKSTVDLFGGEAIGMYYDKRQYSGTAQQVHDLAYKNCINSTLP